MVKYYIRSGADVLVAMAGGSYVHSLYGELLFFSTHFSALSPNIRVFRKNQEGKHVGNTYFAPPFLMSDN